MENRNMQIQKDNGTKKKSTIFWKNFGIACVAIALAILTVIVISLNR